MGKGKHSSLWTTDRPGARLAVASRWPDNPEEISVWLDWVFAGGKLVLLELPVGEYQIWDAQISVSAMGFSPALFASRATDHELVAEMQPKDFFCWHDEIRNQITPLLASTFSTRSPWNPILNTGYSDWGRKRTFALAAAERSYGQGQIVICQLLLTSRLKTNPAAARFVEKLLAPLDDLLSPKNVTRKCTQPELATVEVSI